MGTIIAREKRDGTKSFTAQIRIKKNGKIAYSEAQTFSRKAAANAWLKKREAEVSRPGGMEQSKNDDATLGQSIQKYLDESKKALGRTKKQCLNTLLKHPIAEKSGGDITTTDLTSLIRDLSDGWRPDAENGEERLPQTVGNYMSHLGSVFAIAKPMWGHELDYQAFQSAVLVSKKIGSITSSGKRNRRPTIEELNQLMDHFAERSRQYPDAIPMCDIILFGIFSTRRQSEITSITWSDFEPEQKRILVRDMKHPGQKFGNDVWCDLPPEAITIIQRMPKDDERIFPFNSKTIGTYFTNAGHALSITDLHFHDLRHDGISRIFELGGDIPRAAGVSGHRSWNSLKRYTHIRQVGDKYAGWKWLPKPSLQSEAA